MVKEDIILIGIGGKTKVLNNAGEPVFNSDGKHAVKDFLSINPKSNTNSNASKYHKDYILKEGDTAYIIAYTKPDLNLL